MGEIVQIKNVKKTFIVKKKKFFKTIEKTEFKAVKDVSFNIKKGEIFGLLGPNGAGKTTVIKMIMGLLRPTDGTIMVNGIDSEKEQIKALSQIGSILAGDRSVYWKLTARENLEYFASLYGFSSKEGKERTEKMLTKLGIIDKADMTVEKFSTGMKQKVALGKALIPDAPIILLDEPTLGLDPQSALNLRDIILSLKNEGKTILLTTHYMEEADFLCDRIAIIDNGEIIALDTPDNLKESISDISSLKIEVDNVKEEMLKELQLINLIENVNSTYLSNKGTYEILIHHNDDTDIIQPILNILNKFNTSISNINVLKPSLEDVFIKLTGKALRE
ncbi:MULTISPECIES: ATP-binding cassette domain-containing protein [Clostridium]|uniref:ATP-binding cassette domain-containing protein n=1 Tax=Clostridium senegalense TaxID=1465809 RepID=A0A6M0H5V1_9CLOT|nr:MULTISPECIES: ATP-binding cassette domain-containing protein [Clostridium]NEU06029.1 ATP-binding cassette domain-containing protein [Clostridium senegalense]